MTAKLKTRTSHSIEVDGVEYTVRLAPDRYTDIETRKLADGRMVLGYLIRDDTCDNPLETRDGIGAIYSLSHRHNNHKSADEVQSILENDPDAVPLSYFEHGQCLWDVAGGARIGSCPDMQWDGVAFAGVWVPDDCVRESYTGQDGKTRREWMIKQAESACREYTAWCNGDCWGIVVVTCNPDGSMVDSDECWGYVGSEYAQEALKVAMDAAS